MSAALDRHPKNCAGPFYVVNGECIACGEPESQAGGLMSHDDSGHCFFVRQPSTAAEIDASIRAVWSSCCAALRYGGSDPVVLTRLAKVGESSRCDETLTPAVLQWIRNSVRFEYCDPEPASSRRMSLKRIIRFLSEGLSNGSSDVRSSSYRYWWSTGSFQFHWGLPSMQCTIQFKVEYESGKNWIIRIVNNEIATVGFGMQVDRLLQESPLFREIRWFSDPRIAESVGEESAHPY
jgi:hypothetical protein